MLATDFYSMGEKNSMATINCFVKHFSKYIFFAVLESK